LHARIISAHFKLAFNKLVGLCRSKGVDVVNHCGLDVVTHPIVFRSNDGAELLCCSWDGTIAYFGFTADELGTPSTDEERVSYALYLSIFVVSLSTYTCLLSICVVSLSTLGSSPSFYGMFPCNLCSEIIIWNCNFSLFLDGAIH